MNDSTSFSENQPINDKCEISQSTRNLFAQSSSRNFEKIAYFTPHLKERYSEVIEKLQPAELKRIELIQNKYQRDKISYPATSGCLSRSLQNLVLTGQASRPHSAVSRGFQRDKNNTAQAQISERSIPRRTSNSSLEKERIFWARRHTQEQIKNDERERIQKCYDEKLNRIEKQRNQILKEKERNMTEAHYERERKLRQVQERREQLRRMIDEYRKELHEAREQSMQRALERVSSRLSEEQQRLALERRQKQMQVEENTKEIQRREEELRKATEMALQQKDEHVRRLIEEKEARIQESRNLALAAERLREEMMRVYNLDSFDKKFKKSL
ncbi:unnamed protein product [Heterobilharzia americana]|nr:unnamed protein product [Heterobilharzia americana]